MMRTEPLHTTA